MVLEKILEREHKRDIEAGTIAMYTGLMPPPQGFGSVYGGMIGPGEYGGPSFGCNYQIKKERQTTLSEYGFGPSMPTKPNDYGLVNPAPFLYGYDEPKNKLQFHIHGYDENHLTYGKVVDYNQKTLFEEKDGYKVALYDYILQKNKYNKFP